MASGVPRVLVTRAAEDAEGICHLLTVSGYSPVRVPLLLRRWCVEEVVLAVHSMPSPDLVLVTSAVAADVLAAAVPCALTEASFAAVGPATAHQLRQHGLPAHVIPRRATAAQLVEALGDVRDKTVFYPRSELASSYVVDALRQRGARVYEVVAYTNAPPPGHASQLSCALPVSATTLLSGSAARRLAAAVPEARREQLGTVICIGPSTAAVCHEVRIPVGAVASTHTVRGVLDALTKVRPADRRASR